MIYSIHISLKHKNLFYIFVIILCSITLGYSQEKSKKDHIQQDGKGDIIQLKKEFAQAQKENNDSQEVFLIDKIYRHYSTTTEWDSLRKYSLTLADVQKKNGNLNYHLEALIKVADIDHIVNSEVEHNDSLLTYLYSFVTSNKIKDDQKALICNLVGNSLSERGALDSALILSKRAMEFSENFDPYSAKCFAFTCQYGAHLKAVKKFDLALEVLQKAEKKLDYGLIPDFSRLSLLKIIAQIFFYLEDFEKSISYYNKAMKLIEKNEYITTKFEVLSSLAMVHFKNDNNEMASALLSQTIPFFKEKKKGKRLANDYLVQSKIFYNQGHFKKSSTFIDSASVWILDHIEDNQHLAFEYFNDRIRTDLKLNDLASAKNNLAQIDNYKLYNANKSGKYLKLKYLLAKKEGKTNQALEYYEAYTVKKDSITGSKITLNTQRIESEFNRQQQQIKIENLNDLNVAQDKALGIRNLALTLGGIMLLVLGGLLFGLYRLYLKNQENQKELALQNKQISEALVQNKVLIKEIHHRVKNNLQVVSSLLNMQARKSQEGETKDALNSSKTRVQSMSILHQNLYQGDNLTGVNIEEYLDKVVKNIFDTYKIQDNISLTVDIDPISLDVDTLVPIGLIANELICNALKHAFIGKEKGHIWVEFKQDDKYMTLRIADDGNGLGGEELSSRDGSLGVRLIKSFTKKLDGNISISSNKGTDISIKFNRSSLEL